MAIIRDKVSNFDPIKQVDFVVDFESDVKKLPTTTRGALGKNVPVDLTKPVPMGSKCYVIATGETYILSSTKNDWVKYMAGVVMEEPEDDEEETPVTPPSGGGGGTTPSTPTGKTIYWGNLPTKFTDDGEDTIDLVDDDVTVELVTALSKLTNKTTFKVTGIDATQDPASPAQWCYAYPKAWGNLTKVVTSGIDTLSNFNKKELTIDGEVYNVYYCMGTTGTSVTYDIE